LYYQLVSRNIVENTEKSYAKIGALVSDARLSGLVDWSMISDRGRSCIQNPHWDSPADFLEHVAPQYRIDLWSTQQNYVEVMVEKQALEGVLLPVCRKWDVPFTANKGYSSSSAMYLAGQRFATKAKESRDLHIIYLGDHDPSGLDMSRDIGARMDLFVGTMLIDPDDVDSDTDEAEYLCDGMITVHRVALNMDQIRALQPPENPAKLTDSRSGAYVKKFGYSSWELDAIEPTQLVKLVEDTITSLLFPATFESRRVEQIQGRAALMQYARSYK
jgi:hypothetical protein